MRFLALRSDPLLIAGSGYDDIPFTSQLSIPLTAIARPHKQMGFAAADLLLNVLNGNNPPRRHLLMQPELIVRASTSRLRN